MHEEKPNKKGGREYPLGSIFVRNLGLSRPKLRQRRFLRHTKPLNKIEIVGAKGVDSLHRRVSYCVLNVSPTLLV